MEIKNVIQRLATTYQNLMSKDLTPDEEAQAKVQLLEILSSVKAVAEVQGGERAGNILAQTNSMKDMLLEWDPYGSAWFKEDKTLVNSVYNLLATIKTLIVEKGATTSDSSALNELNQKVEKLATSLRTEIANVKNEVAKVRNSVIALAKAVKDKLKAPPAPQASNRAPAPRPSPAPTPSIARPVPMEGNVSEPNPVPIPLGVRPTSGPKPISLPKPVPLPTDDENPKAHPQPFRRPRNQPIPIPKPDPVQESISAPQPIPLEEPTPIPLSEANLEEPIPLSEVQGGRDVELLGVLSKAKRGQHKSGDKEQLYSLFPSGEGEPAPITGGSELEIVEDSPQPQLAPQSRSVMQLPRTPQSSSVAEVDGESLYQELISLEGKRYSLERSIRDLKTDRENGAISDQEYKEKIGSLLNKLQEISKRIGSIRNKLD